MAPVRNILILGGYGRTGMEIAGLLLKVSRHNISLAGRDQVKAAHSARELNWGYPGQRLEAVEVNVAFRKKLARIVTNYDLVVACISATFFGGQMAEAALEAGVDYIDLNAGSDRRRAMRDLDGEIRRAGLTFVHEAGFAPGAGELTARYAAGHFDSPDDVVVRELDIGPGQRCITIKAAGSKDGREKSMKMTLEHHDPYRAAAIAAVPCILGLLEGSLKNPGAHTMEQLLDPDLYLENLWDLGMTITLKGLSELEDEELQQDDVRLAG